MSVEIRVPQLGESVTEAVVGRWLKKEGDAVGPEGAVVELETDKVNMEVSADESGVLERIVQPEGSTVAIGDVLAMLSAAGGGQSPEASTANGAETMAGASPHNGTVASASSAAPPVAPSSDETAESASRDVAADDVAATPVAKRYGAEHGVDLARVAGTGPSGRVTKEDVAAYLERGATPTTPAAPAAPVPSVPVARTLPAAPQQPAPASGTGATSPLAALFAPEPREERQRMSRRRQTIARRLVEAQHTAAMLTTFNEIDMSAVMELRKRRRDPFKERHGVGLGFMSFFTKAVVGALKAFPRLNAEVQGDEIVLKRRYDIGVAVGAEEGLVVPVLRDADRKSFAAIERDIGELATRARENRLTLAELQGGTFTITNGGTFGSLLSTPILNAPEVGILGMHKIEERPIAVKGEVVIRPMMYVALSYDHRIVDGREAVQFLVRVKELVEDPEALLLEG